MDSTGEITQAVAQASAPSFCRWPRESLQGFALPGEVSGFLADHGLPVGPPPPLVRFLATPHLLGMQDQGDRHLLLGHDGEALLAMTEGAAEIVAWHPAPDVVAVLRRSPDLVPQMLRREPRRAAEHRRFVNSGILHLLECLGCYGSRLDELRRVDEEGVLDIAADLRAEIRRVDPMALADAETWWSRVLERVESGAC